MPALLERDAQRGRPGGAAAHLALGRGSVVLVEGPAGIGKIELLRLARSMAASHEVNALQGNGQPPASVDAMASVATELGLIGSALAGTVVDGVLSGGRQVRQGGLVRSRLAGEPTRLTTPDRDLVLGKWCERGAAGRVARERGRLVVAASSVVPTGAVARLVPAVSAFLRVPTVAGIAASGLARVRVKAQDRPRKSSWARARAELPSGVVREGWLGAGDGMDFAVTVAAEVAQPLARGEGRPRAHTSGALFGPALALAAGGEFLIDQR